MSVHGGGCRRHPPFYPVFLDRGQKTTASVSFGRPGPCSVTNPGKSRDLWALRPDPQAPRDGQIAVNRDIPFEGLHWFFDYADTIRTPNIDRIAALGGGIAIQNRMA